MLRASDGSNWSDHLFYFVSTPAQLLLYKCEITANDAWQTAISHAYVMALYGGKYASEIWVWWQSCADEPRNLAKHRHTNTTKIDVDCPILSPLQMCMIHRKHCILTTKNHLAENDGNFAQTKLTTKIDTDGSACRCERWKSLRGCHNKHEQGPLSQAADANYKESLIFIR